MGRARGGTSAISLNTLLRRTPKKQVVPGERRGTVLVGVERDDGSLGELSLPPDRYFALDWEKMFQNDRTGVYKIVFQQEVAQKDGSWSSANQPSFEFASQPPHDYQNGKKFLTCLKAARIAREDLQIAPLGWTVQTDVTGSGNIRYQLKQRSFIGPNHFNGYLAPRSLFEDTVREDAGPFNPDSPIEQRQAAAKLAELKLMAARENERLAAEAAQREEEQAAIMQKAARAKKIIETLQASTDDLDTAVDGFGFDTQPDPAAQPLPEIAAARDEAERDDEKVVVSRDEWNNTIAAFHKSTDGH